MPLFWFSNQILIPVSPKFPLLGAALVVSNIAPIIYPALCLLMAATDLGPKLDSNFGGFVVKADKVGQCLDDRYVLLADYLFTVAWGPLSTQSGHNGYTEDEGRFYSQRTSMRLSILRE